MPVWVCKTHYLDHGRKKWSRGMRMPQLSKDFLFIGFAKPYLDHGRRPYLDHGLKP